MCGCGRALFWFVGCCWWCLFVVAVVACCLMLLFVVVACVLHAARWYDGLITLLLCVVSCRCYSLFAVRCLYVCGLCL